MTFCLCMQRHEHVRLRRAPSILATTQHLLLHSHISYSGLMSNLIETLEDMSCHQWLQFVAEKTQYCLEKGLSVILCIGEKLEEREANKTFDVVASQVSTRPWLLMQAQSRPLH